MESPRTDGTAAANQQQTVTQTAIKVSPPALTKITSITFTPISAPVAAPAAKPIATQTTATTSTPDNLPVVANTVTQKPAPAAAAVTSPTPSATLPMTSLQYSDLIASDVWQRIRGGFAMSEMNSPLVERHQKWYASRPDYMARMAERGQRYLYFIVEEVERRGMPTEIALLPMIESAFNPGAYSTARASGIWQFIPSTGKNFGMQQNWWYDGRRDIISATNGALDYLQKLHGMFGDWELALAAYNCGENAVQRAQERNRKRGLPVNYASLKLPRETLNYLPKLLAVKNIVNNPERFGMVLQPIANQPYFAPVATARHIDVKLAAELADITLDEFMALNPAHNRPVILQENADVLLLPVDKVETFRANLEQYDEPLVSWQAYKSKKGERLDKLAPKFGLSLAKLRSINGLSPRTKLSNGQSLLVPLNGENSEDEFEVFNTHLASFDVSHQTAVKHTVRKGDTLSNIARRYHVSLTKLKNWNKGVKTLRPGQRIYVAQPGKPIRMAKSSKKKRSKATASLKRINYAKK